METNGKENKLMIEDNAKAIILLEVKFAEGIAADFKPGGNTENIKADMVDFLHAAVCLCMEKMEFINPAVKEEMISSLRDAGKTMGNYEKMAEMLRTVYHDNPEFGETYEKSVVSSGVVMATHLLQLEPDKRPVFFNGYTGFHQMIIDVLSGQLGQNALGESTMLVVR